VQRLRGVSVVPPSVSLHHPLRVTHIVTTETCACPSCSSATLVGSPAAGLCTSCGSVSLAGTTVPLVVLVLAALAARAFVLARRGERMPFRAARMRVASA